MAKRRGNYEGSITRLPSGSYRAQITIHGRRQSFTGATRKQCQEWLQANLQQIADGLSPLHAQTTLNDFMNTWLVMVKSTRRRSTWVKYEQVTRSYILPRLGHIRVRELRPEQIQGLYSKLLESGVGTSTVVKVHLVLHCALEQAVRLGVSVRNPAHMVQPPKEPGREMTIFDEAQVSQFCIVVMDHRWEALFNLALATGARQMELLALKWTDLDWVRCTLKIERQLVRPEGVGVKFSSPKTRFGRRTVVLGAKTIDLLRKHYERQQKERQEAAGDWHEYGLIFTTSVGTPIHPRNLLRTFYTIVESAGLPRIRFHDLRHTAASLMLNSNIPPIVVSRRLGHAKASITLDVYGHLIPTMQADAANIIDGLLAPILVEPKVLAVGQSV